MADGVYCRIRLSELPESWSAIVIKNFDEVKVQLAELSDIINKFKSEQVQLKIVELVFSAAGGESEHLDEGAQPSRKRGRRTRKKTETETPNATDGKKRAGRGDGPVPTLEHFIQEGFFNQKRTIGVVVDHCTAKARNFKSNELSGPLARLVRNNKLTRTKNTDGQWEYVKK